MKSIGLVLAALGLALLQAGTASADPQNSYDTIRVENNGDALLYQVSIDWSPLIVTQPDGGAWAFFTAQMRMETEPGADPIFSNRKLFASRFDPASSTWQPAQALPGEISFGPTGVADAQGNVHLVYSIRNDLSETSFSTLVYLRTTADGGWTGPTIVAPAENAGHQLSADLAIDANGGLHLAWQDQRAVDEETRLADASNADVFVADLNPDGTWTEPVQVNTRPDQVTNASRPQLSVDGDRLVVTWSVYNLDLGLGTAERIDWASRPVSDVNGWSEAQTLIERGETQIGGRFMDMAADPTGGVAMLFGRRGEAGSELYLTRLPAGGDAWSEPTLVAAGDRGGYPRMVIGPEGTIYGVYNLGSNLNVRVGGMAISPGQDVPGAEASLTDAEEGAQGIASVAIDSQGRVVVVYFHEPPQRAAAEVRVLRGAQISEEPLTVIADAPIPTETTTETTVESSPEATPVAEATPSE